MARPTFRYEIISTIFLGLASGALTPQFTQLFARKSLHAAPWILAALMAQFSLGNLFGTFLSPYLQRLRRVRCIVISRVVIAAALGAVAFVPAGRPGAVPFVSLLLLPAMLGSIIYNVMASVWHSNFPHEIRGRLFSRRYLVNILAMVVSIKLAGYALDFWPWAHRLVYPLAAGLMLTGAAIYGRIRVRGERAMIRGNNRARPRVLEGFAMLWRDRPYARYMTWQMMSASAGLMTLPVVPLILTDHLNLSYAHGTTAIVMVPFLVAVMSAPLAGRLFDVMDVTRFRAVNATIWATSRLVLFPAVLCRSWTWMLIAFAMQGLGGAMGGIAYSLAHTQFTHPRKSQLYMGVNLTLQGLRGLTMPFLGIWLYSLPQIGMSLLPLAAAIQLVSAMGFMLSARVRPASQDAPPAASADAT